MGTALTGPMPAAGPAPARSLPVRTPTMPKPRKAGSAPLLTDSGAPRQPCRPRQVTMSIPDQVTSRATARRLLAARGNRPGRAARRGRTPPGSHPAIQELAQPHQAITEPLGHRTGRNPARSAALPPGIPAGRQKHRLTLRPGQGRKPAMRQQAPRPAPPPPGSPGRSQPGRVAITRRRSTTHPAASRHRPILRGSPARRGDRFRHAVVHPDHLAGAPQLHHPRHHRLRCRQPQRAAGLLHHPGHSPQHAQAR